MVKLERFAPVTFWRVCHEGGPSLVLFSTSSPYPPRIFLRPFARVDGIPGIPGAAGGVAIAAVSTRVPMDVVVADVAVSTDIAVGRKKKRWEDKRKGVGTTPNDT